MKIVNKIDSVKSFSCLPIGECFMYLNEFYIKIMPINDKRYIWIGYDKSSDDIFTADYNEYETFDDALNCALVECICYLSLKYKK